MPETGRTQKRGIRGARRASLVPAGWRPAQAGAGKLRALGGGNVGAGQQGRAIVSGGQQNVAAAGGAGG